MTKFRAFSSVLCCVTLSLTLGGAVYAEEANYTINPGSSQSNVDNSCVGAIMGATGEDCSYNQADLWSTTAWVGPVLASGYYRAGDSPFAKALGFAFPEKPVPDPDNAALDISGSVTIEDTNGTTCDGDDTISARFTVEAGTRTFQGGPGTWAEESWGSDTIIYVLPVSLPDSQNPITEGCEYIFGSQGFPPLLTTQGLSAAGIQTYPVDTVIGAVPLSGTDQDAWDTASNPGGIGVGTFEGPGFVGNIGVEVSLDETALMNGTFSCLANSSVQGDPPLVTDGCTFGGAATGTPCEDSGSHFCGARKVMENWIIRIVVDPAGERIIQGQAFALNESIVFNVAPAPDANNSWDGPLITFTAVCDTCSVAKNDNYRFVTGGPATVSLAIGANDDPETVLSITATTLTEDTPGPQFGAGVVTGTQPGNVTTFGYDYTATNGFSGAFEESFSYTLDDGIQGADVGLQADVTISVETDIPPVADAYTIDLDSQGAAPASLSDQTILITGNRGTITIDSQGGSGTATVSGSEITYVPNADFFQGNDSFVYSIVDDNFAHTGGVAPETVGPETVNISIADIDATVSDILTSAEAGETISFVADINLGNGSIAQHEATAVCDNGTGAVDSPAVDGAAVQVAGTYTAPADFEGDVICVLTVRDEDGDGLAVTGNVTITVTNSVIIKLPGGGSALGSWGLLMLIFLSLLRTRRLRRSAESAHGMNSGDNS